MLTINKTKIEVRYQETDQMGVVYHANYLVWFEIGRTNLIEQLGFTYVELENENILLPVIDVHATYIKPVRYGENIFIETMLVEYTGVRIKYHYEVKDDQGEVRITGYTEHAFVRREGFKPVHLRKINRDWHDLLQREVKKEGK